MRPFPNKADFSLLLKPHVLMSLVLTASSAFAQTGEIRLIVEDANGHYTAVSGEIKSRATQTERTFVIDDSGILTLTNLPFGPYQISVSSRGFSTSTTQVDVRSVLPLHLKLVMKVPVLQVEVPVKDTPPLIDPEQTGTVYHLGPTTLANAAASAQGRGTADLVKQQPGWLLEANGILHPRGAEYDTQYVVDGLPLFENRSPAFTPQLDVADVQSLNVLTSNFPAEFGRKLGGVIEATTARPDIPGFHGRAYLQEASYSHLEGSGSLLYRHRSSFVVAGVNGSRGDRHLDPPTLQNLSNHGTERGASVSADQDFNDRDRLQISGRYGRTSFLVPNEISQQQNGQRQSRQNDESSGQIAYRHIFSESLMGTLQARGRDLAAVLVSNQDSTPVIPQQNRGFRDGYFLASLIGSNGRHDWKVGADAIYAFVNESFSYRITDPSFFEPATPPTFNFSSRAIDQEQSAFVQDHVRLGKLTLSAGLRWDHYHLKLDENALSPRLGAAYYLPSIEAVLHASYDRIFQTPAVENLLLASSASARTLNPNSAFLPLRPSRGNYFELGLAKSAFGISNLRLNWYDRRISSFADDNLLLNTGVSFPIAFHEASIHGLEAKIEIPDFKNFSAYASYSYLLGTAELPVAGGLFLGDDVSQLNTHMRVPISQDQRNTVNGRLLYRFSPKFFAAVSASYGSGLPTDLPAGSTAASLAGQYDERILSKVNFARDRVRPGATLDASLGYDIYAHEGRTLSAQADFFNLGDRLNVINFAGLFSGTALAPGRNFAFRIKASF